MSDVKSFLDSSSGSRYPAYKWGVPGAVLAGEIIETPRVIERPNLNTNEPEDNLIIPIRTSEGHEFALWVRRGFLAQAIADAVKEAGADGLAEGGKLAVKHTENRDTGRPQPARVFKAKYEPPAPAAVNPADIFGEEEQAF
jgi:hypothetical protein